MVLTLPGLRGRPQRYDAVTVGLPGLPPCPQSAGFHAADEEPGYQVSSEPGITAGQRGGQPGFRLPPRL